jgi:hypothetical protein
MLRNKHRVTASRDRKKRSERVKRQQCGLHERTTLTTTPRKGLGKAKARAGIRKGQHEKKMAEESQHRQEEGQRRVRGNTKGQQQKQHQSPSKATVVST